MMRYLKHFALVALAFYLKGNFQNLAVLVGNLAAGFFSAALVGWLVAIPTPWRYLLALAVGLIVLTGFLFSLGRYLEQRHPETITRQNATLEVPEPKWKKELRELHQVGVGLHRRYCVDVGPNEAMEWEQGQAITRETPRGRVLFWFWDVRDVLDKTQYASELEPIRRTEMLSWPEGWPLFKMQAVCPRMKGDLEKIERLLRDQA